MTLLQYLKQYTNFDAVIVLFDDLGYTDEEITTKLEISKQNIYDARKRLQELLDGLKAIEPKLPVSYGNKDVNAIVEAFKQSFGTTKTTKYDRWAAKRLSDAYGTDNIVKVIQALADISRDKYTPVVNNVAQLEQKWNSVGKAIANQSNNAMVDL